PATRTFVAYNPGPLPQTVTFTDGKGVSVPVPVPGRTTAVFDAKGNLIVSQTSPDFSLPAPANRFFFSDVTAPGNQPNTYTCLNGQAGGGEQYVPITGPDNPDKQWLDVHAPTTFVVSGLNGNLKSTTAQLAFSLWLDPQYAPPTNDQGKGNHTPLI